MRGAVGKRVRRSPLRMAQQPVSLERPPLPAHVKAPQRPTERWSAAPTPSPPREVLGGCLAAADRRQSVGVSLGARVPRQRPPRPGPGRRSAPHSRSACPKGPRVELGRSSASMTLWDAAFGQISLMWVPKYALALSHSLEIVRKLNKKHIFFFVSIIRLVCREDAD